MICARCLTEGLPLSPEVDELTGHAGRAAAAAITVRDGTALCVNHLEP